MRQEAGRWANNRVENSLVRFRRIRGLLTIAAVHASVSAHFNQERSPSSRNVFKLNRSVALAEWRQFGAA